MNRTVVYNHQPIQIDRTYLDATALCQANGKLVTDWRLNDRTTEFLTELSETMGIPIVSLVEVRTGRHGGTWVHRLAWYHLGQWCNAKCAVWVAKLLDANYAQEFTHAAYGEPLGDLFDSPAVAPIETLPLNDVAHAQQVGDAYFQPAPLPIDTVQPSKQPSFAEAITGNYDARTVLAAGVTEMLGLLASGEYEYVELARNGFHDALKRLGVHVNQIQFDVDDARSDMRTLLAQQAQIMGTLHGVLRVLEDRRTEIREQHIEPLVDMIRQHRHAEGCTCNPRPRGLFPTHRRHPTPCPIHQPSLPGLNGDAAH